MISQKWKFILILYFLKDFEKQNKLNGFQKGTSKTIFYHNRKLIYNSMLGFWSFAPSMSHFFIVIRLDINYIRLWKFLKLYSFFKFSKDCASVEVFYAKLIKYWCRERNCITFITISRKELFNIDVVSDYVLYLDRKFFGVEDSSTLIRIFTMIQVYFSVSFAIFHKNLTNSGTYPNR